MLHLSPGNVIFTPAWGRGRLARLFLAILTGLGLLGLTGWLLPAHPAAVAGPGNKAPIIGRSMVLYNGALSSLPRGQGFTFLFLGTPTQVTDTTGVTLATDNSDQAGYFRTSPRLNRTGGYTVRFNTQVVTETHMSNHRAGFSLLVISSDGRYGLELGFWPDEIWAQHDGITGPAFTHGEGVAFDTTVSLVQYELTILGLSYSLTANGVELLTGSLRDYPSPANPLFARIYETPNLIFLGDDTTSARAAVRLVTIGVITNSALLHWTTTAGEPLALAGLGVMDLDSGGNSEVMTLTVSGGTLTAAAGLPGGLAGGAISGNGTAHLNLTGPVGQLNTTLSSLVYQANPGFAGLDTLTVTINDQGFTGGPALTDTEHLVITVQGEIPSGGNNYLPIVGKDHH